MGCTHDDNSLVLQEKIDQLEQQVDSLTKELSTSKPAGDNPWFDKNQAPKILAHNIPDPEQFIDSSLRSKPDIIPLQAVLGGQMNFNKIQVLGDKWIIADYEDGHVLGKTIFSYTLNEEGELEFRALLNTER